MTRPIEQFLEWQKRLTDAREHGMIEIKKKNDADKR